MLVVSSALVPQPPITQLFLVIVGEVKVQVLLLYEIQESEVEPIFVAPLATKVAVTLYKVYALELTVVTLPALSVQVAVTV